MKNIDWIKEMITTDRHQPLALVANEVMYTVFLRDFYKMPDVNFSELAKEDPFIKALFN
ncbi:MAG: hypothetical protein ACKVQC_10500 [Elusimicrobiota bacterium]